MNTRALATKLVYNVLTNGYSLNQLLPDAKNKCKNAQDAAFLQALIFGVIRWYPRLSFISNQLLQKPIKPKDIELHYLITIGLYQLMEMQVPVHAAISETVEAAKILNKPWATGLVNAVLRAYQRQSLALQETIHQHEEAQYAHPQWLINAIRNAWPEHWETILTANNTPPPLSLRVNTQKNTRDQYLDYLKQNGFEAYLIPYTTAGIILKSPIDVKTLPGFETGLFSVQDGAAQFAAALLHLKPNLRILDACAAPGGKTTHLLETEPNLMEVVALDISPQRTKTIAENLDRLQLKATIITNDATTPNVWWNGKPFDRILLDVPCSATGVIRRHPDIKYLRKFSDFTKLIQQQAQLLNSLWPLLKQGGILVYATCSIFPEENWHMMQKFLNSQQDAYPLTFSIPCGNPQPIGFQLLPGQNDMDGFYYACIGKTEQ